jgi:hypothetical protein
MTGLAASEPPEGLISVESSSPSASRTMSSWKLNGA